MKVAAWLERMPRRSQEAVSLIHALRALGFSPEYAAQIAGSVYPDAQ